MTAGKVRDLCVDGGMVGVRFGVDDRDEWDHALALFKEMIDRAEREWDPDDRMWYVKDTPNNRTQLGFLFDNFERVLDAIESQGTLFDDLGRFRRGA